MALVLALAWPALACQRGAGAPAPAASPPVSATAHDAPPSGNTTAGELAAQGPRRDLSADERRGGHTLARHVGKTDDELRARLARETRISAASTFTDRATAERVVAETLAAAGPRIARWVAREGRRPNLALDYDGTPAVVIGRSVRRGRDEVGRCHGAVVVLKWDEASGDYYVLTSYPEARR